MSRHLQEYMYDYFQQYPFELTSRGGIGVPVFLQDQTTAPLQVRMLQRLGTFTLASPTSQDSFTFTASPGHGLVIGNLIELADATNFMQSYVLNVVGDTITLDTPINKVYTVADTIGVRSTDDLRVNGSVTPQVFTIKPEPAQSGDITALVISMKSTNQMDFSTFGGGAALTRGCTIRVVQENGEYRNLLNFKTNGEFIAQSFNHYFQEKAGGGNYGFVSEVRYAGQENYGVALRLEGSRNEEVQIVISDNLTAQGLTSFKLFARGSELQE